MERREVIENRLISKVLNSPQGCGVYIFLKDKNPIYIGKSKNIRERLKAYIELSDSRETVPKIVEEADDIRWILTPTEEDALFLEQKLIKEYLPKYNIKLKDARGLKFISIDMLREFPSISVTRYPKSDSSFLHFGPFVARDANEIFRAVKNAFGIRPCNETKFKEFRKRGRPCIDGQIGTCSAPCVGKIKREEYMKEVWKAVSFLQGKFSDVISELEKRMWEEAEKENFEISAKLRDRINALRKSLDYKRVVFDDFRNADFISYDIAFGKIGIWAVRVREGRFFGGYGGVFHYGGQDLQGLITQIFAENIKEGVLVSDIFDKEVKIGRILARPPENESEMEIIMNARRNALEQILQVSGTKTEKLRLLDELGKFLLLPQTPRRIEVYDFSNFGGKNLVGAKIHFEDGEIIPSRIRIYKVSDEGHDDYFALQNVLTRRLNDFKNQKDTPLPDIFMIDGGKGHYSVAKRVLEEFGIDIPVVCIKKEQRDTRKISLVFAGEELKPKGKLLSFILRIRDSAHRKAKKFAISSSTSIKAN